MTKDKLYHLIAGFVIALIFGLFNPIAGLVIAVGAGIAKDVVWDLYLKRGTFEVLDIFATVIGAVIGAIGAIVATTINL
jgi:glycopeptide antibiotics resistance protein